jgi:hypothetical protein
MRRISWLCLGATSVALVVIGPAGSAADRWTWRGLHRPLHIPRIDPGAPCPLSALTTLDLGQEGMRSRPGRGPAYPSLSRGSMLEFFYPPIPAQSDFYGTEWGGQKVLWWVSGSYHGPVLIRGRQLDGPNVVRFDRGSPVPQKEIRIKPGPGYGRWKGARDRASYTRLRAAGCYAYQIDGTNFSRVIIFEAKIVPPPS